MPNALAQPPQPPAAVPPLRDGDRMKREEFHRRYEAMGPSVRAELIEGIVHLYEDQNAMPSPASYDHGGPYADASGWIYEYRKLTPGLISGLDCTVFADNDNEPQPDLLLGIPESVGGRARLIRRGRKRYFAEVPELLIEVAASTERTDLNEKRRVYERNGAAEYLVLLPEREPAELLWLAAGADGRFAQVTPDPADGLLKSRALPGLWLDEAALWAGDLPALSAAVERGCATPEHAAFVERLAGGGAVGRARNVE